jgi:hypothetical protein
LSSVQPLFPIERSVAAIEALGGVESAAFLDSLRMRSLVFRRLSALESPSDAVRECLQGLSSKVTKLGEMHAVLDENLHLLRRIATAERLELFGGKGVAAHTIYTDPSVRDFNDLDIFVRTRADASRLSRALRAGFGYDYQIHELPWLKLDPADGLVYGQIALVAPRGDEHLLNIDIHFGEYSVRHCARLDLTATLPAGPPGFRLVAPEENLACIVNNAAGDYFVTAKDTNDLLMTISLESFDPERLAAQLRRSHLAGFFGSIVDMLEATSHLTAEQRSRLRTLPRPRTLEPAPPVDRPSWTLRCVGTTVHAFAARRHAGLIPAVKVAAGAFDYYRRRLKLKVVAGDRPHGKPIAFNPWTCIRLVPMELAQTLLHEAHLPVHPGGGSTGAQTPVDADPAIARFDTEAGTYFKIDGEVFIATVDYTVSADVVRRAMSESGQAG